LCQPIDIRINKLIKSKLREKWEQWLMEGGGVVDSTAREPLCKNGGRVALRGVF
jgi:hypothetical protein